MALKAPAAPLVATLTQGVADAFVQASISTGLSGRTAFRVAQIFFEITSGIEALAADFAISMCVTRRSKAALPLLSDSDVIYKRTTIGALVTSGFLPVEALHLYVPPMEIPIVEETIYVQLDSGGTGLALNAICRIDVEADTMSEIDRLNLITRSLQ